MAKAKSLQKRVSNFLLSSWSSSKQPAPVKGAGLSIHVHSRSGSSSSSPRSSVDEIRMPSELGSPHSFTYSEAQLSFTGAFQPRSELEERSRSRLDQSHVEDEESDSDSGYELDLEIRCPSGLGRPKSMPSLLPPSPSIPSLVGSPPTGIDLAAFPEPPRHRRSTHLSLPPTPNPTRKPSKLNTQYTHYAPPPPEEGTMGAFSLLPSLVLYRVASQLEQMEASSLLSLSLVNRTFRDIAQEFIFRAPSFPPRQPADILPSSNSLNDEERLTIFLSRTSRLPHLCSHIVSLSINFTLASPGLSPVQPITSIDSKASASANTDPRLLISLMHLLSHAQSLKDLSIHGPPITRRSILLTHIHPSAAASLKSLSASFDESQAPTLVEWLQGTWALERIDLPNYSVALFSDITGPGKVNFHQLSRISGHPVFVASVLAHLTQESTERGTPPKPLVVQTAPAYESAWLRCIPYLSACTVTTGSETPKITPVTLDDTESTKAEIKEVAEPVRVAGIQIEELLLDLSSSAMIQGVLDLLGQPQVESLWASVKIMAIELQTLDSNAASAIEEFLKKASSISALQLRTTGCSKRNSWLLPLPNSMSTPTTPRTPTYSPVIPSPRSSALSRSASLGNIGPDATISGSQLPNIVRKWVVACPSGQFRTIDLEVEDSKSASGTRRSTFGVRRGGNGRFSLARIDI